MREVCTVLYVNDVISKSKHVHKLVDRTFTHVLDARYNSCLTGFISILAGTQNQECVCNLSFS